MKRIALIALLLLCAGHPARTDDIPASQTDHSISLSALSPLSQYFQLSPAPELVADYESISVLYFKGKLPPVDIQWETGLLDSLNLYALAACDDNHCKIRIDPLFREHQWIVRATLLHEAAHCYVATRTKERESHGKKWLATMKRLVKQGAYDEVF